MNETRNIPFGRPWIEDDERNAVVEVLKGHVLTHGPQCKSFEEKFTEYLGGEGHCLTVSSCTAGLHLIYMHFGIGQGDEVIVPAQTHTATAHAVEYVGAKPVFIDCLPESGNIDHNQIESHITEKTKAISVVHFLGIPCDMEKICAIANKHNLKVVEDCALAIGTRFNDIPASLWGDAAAFSFYPVKHITTAEGGMLVTKHQAVCDSIKLLRAFGVDRTYEERNVPGMYDVKMLGYNYRMSEVQAVIGIQQMSRVSEILIKRKNNFSLLKESLSPISDISILDAQHDNEVNSHYCLTIVLQNSLSEKRTDFIMQLKEAGVGTSIYYPQPVPRFSYYKNKYGYDASCFPNAEKISDCSIALPVGPHLGREDLEYIAEQCKKIAGELA